MYFHASSHCNRQDLIYRQDLSTDVRRWVWDTVRGLSRKAFITMKGCMKWEEILPFVTTCRDDKLSTRRIDTCRHVSWIPLRVDRSRTKIDQESLCGCSRCGRVRGRVISALPIDKKNGVDVCEYLHSCRRVVPGIVFRHQNIDHLSIASTEDSRQRGKCMFCWEMHVSSGKCMCRWKNMKCAFLCKSVCVVSRTTKKMHVWSKNACFIAKCPIRREIIVHISWKKMPNSSQNAQCVEK